MESNSNEHGVPGYAFANFSNTNGTPDLQSSSASTLEQGHPSAIDESKQTTAVNTQVRATDRHHEHVGMSAFDHETNTQVRAPNRHYDHAPTSASNHQLQQLPMEISDDNEQGVSGRTYADFFHTNGAPVLQMAASTLEQGHPSALSFNNKENLAKADQTQEFDSNMPASSLTDNNTDDNTVTAAPGVQVEVSGQYSSSSDLLTTSGISADDDFDSSEQELPQNPPDLQREVTPVPCRVPLQGGDNCRFDFKPGLPPWCSSGSATFGNLGSVNLWSHNNSMYGNEIPSKLEPGWVTVSLNSETGIYLGETKIFYFDKDVECVEMVFQQPKLCKLLLCKFMAMSIGGQTDAGGSETQNSINLGSTQPAQVLQLVVYAAAKSGAQQFIEMIFNSSAGRVIFDAYKDSSPLPEDIARNHGHEKTARYLEDITTRFSKEMTIYPEGSQTIDWAELVAAAEAVQEQHELSIANEEESHQVESDETIDTGYFGDAETSSKDSSQRSSSGSEDDVSDISFEGSIKECEIELKADAYKKQTDGKGASSSLDSSDLTDIHSEEKKVETHCCLNEGCNAEKENVTKRQTSQLIFHRPVTSFSGCLPMSFIKEGVFPSKQLNGKGRRNTNNPTLEEKCFSQMIEHFYREVHDLQQMKSVHHPGISFLLSIATERIPHHLSTMYERWRTQLQFNRESGKNIAQRLSLLFHKMDLGPADGRLAISSTQPAVVGKSNFVQDLEPSYVDYGLSIPNDEYSPIKGKALDYPTKHRSTTSDAWVLTDIYRPTRKILFVYVADRSDALPPESWFKDEDCELSTECWKWQRCGNNSFKFIERLKGMQECPELEQLHLDPSTLDPHITYMLPHKNAAKVTQYEGCQSPGWIYPMLYHCWTYDPVNRPPFIATFDNVLVRDPMISWIMTSGLSNSDEGIIPELDIYPPQDTCHVTNAKKRLGKGLAKNTSLTTLTLSINESGEMSVGWAYCLAKGLEKNTSLTTLTLSINESGKMSGSWAYCLGKGLAKNTSLTTLTLSINESGVMSGDWAYGLAEGLEENTSLTTITFNINIQKSMNKSCEERLADLAERIARSKSLTSFTLNVNNQEDLTDSWGVGLAKRKETKLPYEDLPVDERWKKKDLKPGGNLWQSARCSSREKSSEGECECLTCSFAGRKLVTGQLTSATEYIVNAENILASIKKPTTKHKKGLSKVTEQL